MPPALAGLMINENHSGVIPSIHSGLSTPVNTGMTLQGGLPGSGMMLNRWTYWNINSLAIHIVYL